MSKRKAVLLVACLVAFNIGCRKPTAAEHVQRATAYFDKAQYAESIVEFRLALQANPKLGEARLKLGDAYMRVNDPKNALGEYVRAADLMPSNLDAQLKAGNLLLAARGFEEAKARAEQAIKIDAKNVEAQVLRGNALAGLKDLDGAMSEYEEAIALDPTQNTAYANLGTIQFAQGKREEAEQTFRKAVEVAPKSAAARLALANFLWAAGRQSDSEQTFKSALEIDPKNLVANRALGLFYMATGRVAEAEPFLLTIFNASKTTAASLTLADYYILVKRYEDARRILRDLADHSDAYGPATVRLASIDGLEGNRAQAHARLHEVLAKNAKDASALLLDTQILLTEGKRDEALTLTKTIVGNDPTAPAAAQAYSLAGRIHRATDRIDDAISDYEQVLKLQSRPLAADLALAEIYLGRLDAKKAAGYAQQALAIQPSNPVARSLLIRSDVEAGALDKANAELEPLRKEFPDSPTVADLTANVQLAQKNVDAARASYAKALQLAPDDYTALVGTTGIDLAAGRSRDATARIETRLGRTAKPSVELLLLAGRTFAAAGDFAKAETVLRQAIDADPDRLQAYILLGGLYAGQRRLEEATAEVRELLKHDPKSLSASTLLGMLLEQQGRLPEAEEEYQRVLAVEPRAVVAANNLAWRYVSTNRKLDEALQLAQTAHQLAPDEPNINDTLGWIYYRKNMAAQAVPYLEASAKNAPNEPSIQFHLGMAYVQVGDWNRARTALKQALSSKRQFDGAADALKALTMIGS